MVNSNWPTAPQLRSSSLGNLTQAITSALRYIGLRTHCLNCMQAASERSLLCEFCHSLLKKQYVSGNPHCYCCSVSLAVAGYSSTQYTSGKATEPSTVVRQLCGNCIQQTPSFSHCIAAVNYDALSAKLIAQFKYHGDLANGREIAQHVGNAVDQHYAGQKPPVDLIIPVPMHNKKLVKRGFNQSLEIAKHLSKRYAIPLYRNASIRMKETAAQQTLGKKARALNTQQLFSANATATLKINGKHIAIVDDVVTTGSTANALTKCLVESGASTCEIWCFARTPVHS